MLTAVVLGLQAPPLLAQDWNGTAVAALVRRAVERRTVAQADTGLRSYRATAHGFVFFLAQMGAGLTEPPRLVKADQLEVEVYWRAPGLSKQRILGWRDGRYLPTDINYHRDHLGIVTNNFGNRIRIGEGDEVRDLVHPLSPDGLTEYDFALGDSLTVTSAGRELHLVAVRVRPRVFSRPLVIGTLYLDLATADLVRFRFSFTPSAYLDRSLEDITVSLENALYEGRFWLPYLQEIEIRRQATWFDFPARSIIRGRWQVGEYELNLALPDSVFQGAAIGGLMQPADSGYPWAEPLRTAIGTEASPIDRQDLDAVRVEVQRIAGDRALEGLPAGRIGSNSVSDLVHVNRVEGVALGLGVRLAVAGFTIRPAIGYGTSSRLVTGRLQVSRHLGAAELGVFGIRQVRDFSELPIISTALNSLTAQEAANDHGDYVTVASAGCRLRQRLSARSALAIEARVEDSRSLATTATPAAGVYRANPQLGAGTYGVAGLQYERTGAGFAARHDIRGMVGMEVGGGPSGYVRAVLNGEWLAPAGPGQLLTRAYLGAGSRNLPAYRSFVLGGRGTLLGEEYRAFGGIHSAWATAEWRVHAPFPGVGLGPYASTGRTVTLAPFFAAGWTDQPVSGTPWAASSGVRTVAGLAAEFFLQLIRLEAGVALRTGRVGVTVDVTRNWWGVL